MLIHFIIPFGKFGLPYLGKATAAPSATLPSPTSACWVFSCFCKLPNSDMDYRILMCVPDHSYACVYTGVGHTTNESAQVLTKKTSQIFLCSWRGLNLGSVYWSLSIEPPHYCNSTLWGLPATQLNVLQRKKIKNRKQRRLLVFKETNRNTQEVKLNAI